MVVVFLTVCIRIRVYFFNLMEGWQILRLDSLGMVAAVASNNAGKCRQRSSREIRAFLLIKDILLLFALLFANERQSYLRYCVSREITLTLHYVRFVIDIIITWIDNFLLICFTSNHCLSDIRSFSRCRCYIVGEKSSILHRCAWRERCHCLARWIVKSLCEEGAWTIWNIVFRILLVNVIKSHLFLVVIRALRRHWRWRYCVY